MSLSAIGSLADSIDATRDFLFSPLEPRRWLALALVVLFAGGIGGFNPLGFSGGVNQQDTQQPEPAPTDAEVQEGIAELQDVIAENLPLLVAGVAVLLLIGLLLRFVAAVFQFVFVESLRRESVDVRGYAGENLRKSAGLLAFQIAVDLVTFLPVAVLGWLLWDQIVSGEIVDASTVPWNAVLPVLAVGVVLGVLGAIVHGLTTSFVVPTMLVEDCGVLAGWHRFLPVLVGSIVEYVVYGIVAFVLQIALGSVVGILTGIASLVVIVPLALVGVVVFFGLGGSTAGGVLLGLLVVLGLLLILVVFALVQVPFASYLRYYALFVLGDTDPELDPVPDVRQRVREDSVPGTEESV